MAAKRYTQEEALEICIDVIQQQLTEVEPSDVEIYEDVFGKRTFKLTVSGIFEEEEA